MQEYWLNEILAPMKYYVSGIWFMRKKDSL